MRCFSKASPHVSRSCWASLFSAAGIESSAPISNFTLGQATRYIIAGITEVSAGDNCTIWVDEGVQCGGQVGARAQLCVTCAPPPRPNTAHIHAWRLRVSCPASQGLLILGETLCSRHGVFCNTSPAFRPQHA